MLYYARDNEPVEPVPVEPEFTLRSFQGVVFPSLEYNNIPVDMTTDPAVRYNFLVELEGNVWVHAADPRTFYPHPVVPTGFTEGYPRQIDARIQVVWPHDNQGNFAPVDKATYVNIAIELFEHHTLKALPDYSPFRIVPYFAEGNEPIRPAVPVDYHWLSMVRAERVPYRVGNQEFIRWVYNNIPVEPGKQYHFLVKLWPLSSWPEPPQGPFQAYTSIWTHAADARTLFPHPEVPPPCF